MPVYMIRAGANGPVKIGFTDDLPKRLRYMQTGNHETLTVLRQFEGGPAEEARLHERFADNHLRGEWHHFCRAMLGDLGLVEIIEPPREKRQAPTPYGITPDIRPLIETAADAMMLVADAIAEREPNQGQFATLINEIADQWEAARKATS